jgi:DNA processing protein
MLDTGCWTLDSRNPVSSIQYPVQVPFTIETVSESSATDQQLLDALHLNLVDGIGPRLQQLLVSRFGSPAAVLAAGAQELCRVNGIGAKLAAAITQHCGRDDAEREFAECRKLDVKLILRDAAGYPPMLAEICDAPQVLYCRGRLESQDQLAVAIVGGRRCTTYGRQQAERLAGGLSRAGMTIVSGLARGIDAAAHRGALSAGGRTIAVTATGLASIYPPEHDQLADEIAGQGAILTESPLDRKAIPGLFPQRNRLISGLSLGVIIVEASQKSGALHTARHAMEQGREVFALPGRVDNLANTGCHNLIRDGVTLIRGVDDVLDELGPLMRPVSIDKHEEVHRPRELTLNEQERHVLNLIDSEPSHIDEVLRTTNLESSRVLATLTVLEMKRMIRRLPGGYLVRATN